MKVVVTGGAGFIGSNIAEELAKKYEVVIVDDLSSGKLENIRGLNLEFVRGCVTDIDLLKKVFRDAEYVFHQAAIASVQKSLEDPLKVEEVNVRGTLCVLIAARDADVEKVVFASSAAVYGDSPELPKRENMTPQPKSPYAVSKLAGEYYCEVFNEVYGLKTVSLRYFNVYGPRQDLTSEYAAVIPRFLIRSLAGKPLVIYGDGNQTRDFVFVKDVVNANILAMEKNVCGVFNVASGKAVSINELAEVVMKVVGKNVEVVYERERKGDVRHSLGDISKARTFLGYVPEYSLEEGLRITLKWLIQSPNFKEYLS